MRSQSAATKSSPRWQQLEKAGVQQRRPNTAKNKNKLNKINFKKKTKKPSDCRNLSAKQKSSVRNPTLLLLTKKDSKIVSYGPYFPGAKFKLLLITLGLIIWIWRLSRPVLLRLPVVKETVLGGWVCVCVCVCVCLKVSIPSLIFFFLLHSSIGVS